MLKLTVETVAPGSYVFVEDNEARDYFYIIRGGEVQCVRRYNRNARSYGVGNIIGVVSCMTGHSQTETVRVKEQATLVKVFRSQYEELIRETPGVAMKIVQMLSRDLRSFNEAYEKRTGHSDGTGNREEQLFGTARYYELKGQLDAACFAYYQYAREVPDGPHAGEARSAYERLRQKSRAVYLDPSGETSRFYPKGTMVFAEGQSGSELFIVGSGSVCISRVVNGEEQAIVYFKKGDMLGDMALLETGFRSANAIAAEDSRLVVLNRQNFDQMVATQPEYIQKLTATLAKRYWYSYRRYGNACFSDPKERLVDMLAMQVEMNRSSYDRTNSYATDLGLRDLMVLCNLDSASPEELASILASTQGISLKNGRIVVKDVTEVLKQAEFYRKKRDR